MRLCCFNTNKFQFVAQPKEALINKASLIQIRKSTIRYDSPIIIIRIRWIGSGGRRIARGGRMGLGRGMRIRGLCCR